MDLSFIEALIQAEDPVGILYRQLTEDIWTPARFAAARERGDLHSYLRDGEHLASKMEHELYRVYDDVYTYLEQEDPRQLRIQSLDEQAHYTLLLIDALSLREIPLILERMAAHNLTPQVDIAMVPPPTETSDFARRHYGASGPSALARQAHRHPFAFRHVTEEAWQPNFQSDEQRRFIWYVFPDNYFKLKTTNYTKHVVQPVGRILDAVLGDPDLVRPLIITSDHGYLWQGASCTWPLDAQEARLMAKSFKHGRSTTVATERLAATGKVWVQENVAAARGRFAWGGRVRGDSSLFKHGGVSLMECLAPWVTAN
jgi:hypothetical protein